MPDSTSGWSQSSLPPQLWEFNSKVLSDDEMDFRRAWESVRLEQAQITNFNARNAAVIAHFVNSGLALAGQVGVTESQQTVSPAGTSASEAIKGAVGAAAAGEAVSAEAVTANVANLFTALTPVIASALATAISQTVAALVPVVVTAAGGASTPSQTKPPTGA